MIIFYDKQKLFLFFSTFLKPPASFLRLVSKRKEKPVKNRELKLFIREYAAHKQLNPTAAKALLQKILEILSSASTQSSPEAERTTEIRNAEITKKEKEKTEE